MYSPDDVQSVQEFLKNTPEKSLRQMLVVKAFTEVHLQLLLKIARGCTPSDFVNNFESEKLPHMKYSQNEIKIREKFWMVAKSSLNAMGLLGTEMKKSA